LKPTKKKIFIDFITARGLKSTRQRIFILDAFLSFSQSMSVDELYMELRARHPSIGYTTVYRTMKLLAESGIAREIKTVGNPARYENVTGKERHDRIVCTCCGTITVFENGTIGDLLVEFTAGHGFLFETHKLELRGLCTKCRE